MEQENGGGGGSSGHRGSDGTHHWFERRQSVKVGGASSLTHPSDRLRGSRELTHTTPQRNFGTMNRDDTPDSLFLPFDHNHDPHYENGHASRRRRMNSHSHLHRERSVRYSGDGFDYRRPVMSTGLRESPVVNGLDEAAAAAPPVIDLTDEIEGDSGNANVHINGGAGDDEVEVTGASEAVTSEGISRAGAGQQRLPRFGRDVIDVEEHQEQTRHNHDHLRPRALLNDDEFGELPGADYLALPPRRSASGRVQYSTLRRPTRPPSPPLEMDDEEIAYLGTRPFANVQERRPTPGPAARFNPNYVPRSVTPYPADLNEPIDLTNDADDDVLIVDSRSHTGVNLEQPNAAVDTRTQAANDHEGFGIGRIANLLREGGAALGGRLAQRALDFGGARRNYYDGMTLDQIRARRRELEEQTAAAEERRARVERDIQREVEEFYPHVHPVRPGDTRRRARVRQVRATVDRNGNVHMPGFHGVNWGHVGNTPQLNIGMMDYGAAAFDMGFGGREERRPPTPKYSPPPDAERGFTRNPGEEEVVVCPNCGDELAVGDGEAKQEIWVGKGCGHAYCGNCARNRSKSRKGKGRAVDAETLPPPFHKCVVEGCWKSMTGKNMVRVYFGS